MPDFNLFIRGVDPSAIADVTLAGINLPIRLGGATVLPGDVMLGTPTGLIFIPPHLVQEVVEKSEAIRVRDEFGKMRLDEGKSPALRSKQLLTDYDRLLSLKAISAESEACQTQQP